jgi:hypothetical protein
MVPVYLIQNTVDPGSGINTPDSGSKKSNKRGGETKFKLILFFNRLRKKFEPIH